MNPPDSTREFISRFEILSELGSGGMGVVYKAIDPYLEKTVAVKVVGKTNASDDIRLRFQREAKAIKDLRHPAIPEVYNFAISRDEQPYMVMEFVEGRSLQQVLKEDGALSVESTLEIIDQVCDALAYAHSHGVVHRDLKPANLILVDRREDSVVSIKVIDFGLAKLEPTNGQELDMTETGIVIGSPPYMSPEQVRGADLDGRSDIYSLGCVMFELLTGVKPFKGANALETITLQVSKAPPRLSDRRPDDYFSDELEYVVAKCLEKEPGERYQSMNDLKSALQTLEEEETQSVLLEVESQDESEEVLVDRASSSTNLLVAVAVLGLIGLCVLVFAALNASDSPQLPEINRSHFQEPNQKEDVLIEGMMTKGVTEGGTHPGFHVKINESGIRTINADPNVDDDALRVEVNNYKTFTVWNLSKSKVTADGLTNLTNFPIYTLNVNSTAVDAAALREISKIKTLRGLFLLRCNNLHNEDIAILEELPLVSIGVSGNNINGDVCERVSKIKTLKNATFGKIRLTPARIDFLKRLPYLERLTLQKVRLSKPSSAEIAEAMQIEVLGAYHYKTPFKRSWVRELSRSKTIKQLDFRDAQLEKGVLKELENMKGLRRLNLRNVKKINQPELKRLRKKLPDCSITIR